jgi:ABC-type multidrug transport system ATPase subunit
VIARALLHQPRLLFLDEPTRGLDPAVALELRQLIAGLAAQGVTVFLTTHYMEEADQLCNRVAFMHDGKIAALDTPERLKIAYGKRCAKVLMVDGSRQEILLDEPGGTQALAELVSGGQVQTIHSGEATLEEVFLQLTGRRLLQ